MALASLPARKRAHPATRARTQRPRKYLGIHAAELALEPNFQILRRHRRSLLLRLEHAHRSAVENHVHCAPRLGSRKSLNLRIGRTRQCPAALLWFHEHDLDLPVKNKDGGETVWRRPNYATIHRTIECRGQRLAGADAERPRGLCQLGEG